MRLPYKCPLCSKTFRTPQGRRGHLTFKHGQGKESIYTRAIGTLIDAHKEGIEDVKKKRRKILPRYVSIEGKKEEALRLSGALEGKSSYPKEVKIEDGGKDKESKGHYSIFVE